MKSSPSTAEDAALKRMLLEQQQLRRLAEWYAQAADSNQPQLLERIMTEDAVIEGPGFRLAGIAEIRGIPAMLKARYLRTRHLVHNQTAEIDGDQASGETYCSASHLLGAEVLVWHLRYQDEFRRQDGQWRFCRRLLLIDWTETRAVDVAAS